jgi:hypothetical protein
MIIEIGIDVPTANTIIDRADRFGWRNCTSYAVESAGSHHQAYYLRTLRRCAFRALPSVSKPSR